MLTHCGTYVFATQSTGSTNNTSFTYFLAPLCDSSGMAYPNPMPNTNTWNAYAPFYSGTTAPGSTVGSGVYIYDIAFSGINSLQVPQVINNGQSYLLSQLPVPKFKQLLVWNSILWGIGDPDHPSRIWYSQIDGPQIFRWSWRYKLWIY